MYFSMSAMFVVNLSSTCFMYFEMLHVQVHVIHIPNPAACNILNVHLHDMHVLYVHDIAKGLGAADPNSSPAHLFPVQ